ncbi:AraC family transcriptional regulator [Chitinophaga sp. sic0106]|uniref:AraC family transcriptional regulator n=1 Tax=Chitinophaga sp. sic0106 TaxID=2854785 RepID=UPI001C4885B7|nr:helix-turn-helix domain-containing protein [Chitinophaga sp. sic0106]MBV7530178.1 AraC family transcriptional regulator [Chitinophaga sp. sic0106]
MQPNSSQLAEKETENKKGSHKNIWYGIGRHRIEIPKTVLKAKVQSNDLMKALHIRSIGYYPKAQDHYTYRKKGLPENFLFFCVDGHGWYQVNGKRYEVGPNESFILPQNIEHAYGSSEDNPWSIYWIHFGGDALLEFNRMQAVQKYLEPHYIKNNGDIIPLFNKIYKSLELGYSLDNLVYANMGLVQYLNLFIYNTRHYEATLTDKSDCVDNAILYMQQRINDKISLNELGKQYNYSVSRFSNLFKQKTGYAPIDYFVQLKMQKACQQLDFTTRSVKDIAFSMGFDDPYYFSRRFRAVIGMSPKKYRLLNNDQRKSPS